MRSLRLVKKRVKRRVSRGRRNVLAHKLVARFVENVVPSVIL